MIWVTVFDSKGNLLRTVSGFFISADGRFVTTAHAIEGGVNAVAKTADGGIYNVSGILRASKELDLAVLQAEVKPAKLLRFLDLNKNDNPPVGVGVVVIGSALAGNEGNARQMTIAAQASDRLEITGATPGRLQPKGLQLQSQHRDREWSTRLHQCFRPALLCRALRGQVASV